MKYLHEFNTTSTRHSPKYLLSFIFQIKSLNKIYVKTFLSQEKYPILLTMKKFGPNELPVLIIAVRHTLIILLPFILSHIYQPWILRSLWFIVLALHGSPIPMIFGHVEKEKNIYTSSSVFYKPNHIGISFYKI